MARESDWYIIRRGVDLRMHIILNRSTPNAVARASGVHFTAIGPILAGERVVKRSDAEAIVAAAPGNTELNDWFAPSPRMRAGIEMNEPDEQVTDAGRGAQIDPTGRDAILAGRGTR
ncbi:hypothetical protein [Kineosporia babensis]|uniref:Uncharacterized protein n=1 Tax=Kineosporia babensis TaxID=499548 RepID=A0A9X1ST46_9ACTN|nr:hypothetical protein [Kineosporia babensis]MCD5310946.1 hypothetical protein [Kineosporia babensis]